jgi:hypothetical protein
MGPDDRCAECERLRAQLERLLDVFDAVRENSVRATDGYLTIDPEIAAELIVVLDDVYRDCGREPVEEDWP